MRRSKEREYYADFKSSIEGLLEFQLFGNLGAPDGFREERAHWQEINEIFDQKYYYLEVTANWKFSNKLKAQIGPQRDIIFNFLKDAAPDITGFIREKTLTEFIVVEFKKERLKLADIYQTKKYAELFDAIYAIAVSTEEIPEELKRLSDVAPHLLLRDAPYRPITLAHYDTRIGSIWDWFPETPFQKTPRPQRNIFT